MYSKKINILIVEDNTELMANIADYLENNSYSLDFAYNGAIALHLINNNEYDVIVMDVMLPGMSGFMLCHKIRQELKLTTPIILITAKSQIDDKVVGFTNGADDYLVKPFNLKELEIRIQALSRRNTPSQSILQAGSVEFELGTLRLRIQDSNYLQLSGTAANIMQALLKAYPNFISYERLSQYIWEEKQDMHTLRTHIYSLRKNLMVAFGFNVIKTLHGKGYILIPPEDQ